MISFVGYSGAKPNENTAYAMLERMVPDKTKTEVLSSGSFVFGKKELSDRFSTGSVTYTSAERCMVLFSGRLSNKEQLASILELSPESDDAEIVACGYKKWGASVAEKLLGMFSFAVYDGVADELLLARDRFGIRPMYYYFENGNFIFASRLKAFPEHPDFVKEFNDTILQAYLCFNSTPTTETFFKNVYRLEPGCALSFKGGKISKSCFAKLVFDTKERPISEMADEIHSAVTESIKRNTQDKDYATFLSGGVDSSYMATMAKPEITYTVGYDDQHYDETVHTSELIEKLGIQNKVRRVSAEEYLENFEAIVEDMDEPLADPSAAALYFGMKEASKDVKIVMSGEGADELFGGYNSYLEEITHQKYMKRPYFIRHLTYLATCRLPESRKYNFFYRRGQTLKNFHIGLDRVFKDFQAAKILKINKQKTTRQVIAPLYAEYKDCNTLQQRQAVDFYFWLIGDFLHAVTRSGDAFGVQTRFPFLDEKVCEVASTLPDSAKLSTENTKVAFRLAAQKVVPTDAYKRKKLGFPVPLKEWIKSDAFYNEIKAKFTSSSAEKFFDTKAILLLLDDHREEKRDCYKKIWTIYTFLVWYDLYFA